MEEIAKQYFDVVLNLLDIWISVGDIEIVYDRKV